MKIVDGHCVKKYVEPLENGPEPSWSYKALQEYLMLLGRFPIGKFNFILAAFLLSCSHEISRRNAAGANTDIDCIDSAYVKPYPETFSPPDVAYHIRAVSSGLQNLLNRAITDKHEYLAAIYFHDSNYPGENELGFISIEKLRDSIYSITHPLWDAFDNKGNYRTKLADSVAHDLSVTIKDLQGKVYVILPCEP